MYNNIQSYNDMCIYILYRYIDWQIETNICMMEFGSKVHFYLKDLFILY